MATYKPLQSVSLTSATTSITFSGIDQNYTDLVLVASTTVATASANLVMTFNGDTTSGLYSKTQIEGTGSVVTSGRTTGANNIGLDSNMGSDTTNPSIHIINLTNYSNTTGFKTILHRQSSFWSANPGTALRVGLWRNTSAITSITLTSTSINFNAGSTFDLYGIKSGAPQALGGDLVTTDGNYWYHTFRTTGSFSLINQKPLTVDYLVVAGGGGGGGLGNGVNGGYPGAGGGGAGGYRTSIGSTTLNLSSSESYTVVVGAGGTGKTGTGGAGSSGTNSVFSTITSTGGGGGNSQGQAGTVPSGGSGGGAGTQGNDTGGLGNTPSTSPSQGNNGGSHTTGDGASGGGGASAAGSANSGLNGGAGGAGTANSISGSSVTYAGGGGGGSYSGGSGGAGGAGGGGAGNTYNSGVNVAASGTANTGGGGGGAAMSSPTVGLTGGNGGSGIVIVRYPV